MRAARRLHNVLFTMFEKPRASRLAVLLVGLLVLAFFLARHFVVDGGGGVPDDAPTYTAREAADHVGEAARVCGTVADAAYRPRIGGSPTFLNFGAPHPDADFTVVIWSEARARFDVPPESGFRGRRICVSGRIREHEGRPQIVLEHPSQVTDPDDTDGGRRPGG